MTGKKPVHLQKLGLLMATGMQFPNTPGEVARVQGFPELLRNSSPFPRHFSLQALCLPSASQERVKLPSKMADLFCTSEGVTREVALCLWGGSQGPAALPGTLPQVA